MPSRTKQRRSTLDKHSVHRQKILEVLNLRDEFQALGLRLKGEPSSDGWMQCHAFDREDKTPSAAVNVKTGRYKDFGQAGKERVNRSLKIFLDSTWQIIHFPVGGWFHVLLWIHAPEYRDKLYDVYFGNRNAQ